MDDDLRNAFATLSAQISVVATDLRANTSLTADLTRSVADVRTEQKAQAGRIGVIEKAVFGSDPPPAPAAEPMVRQLSEHDGDIATLAGQIIAANAKLDALAKKPDTAAVVLSEVREMAKKPLVQKLGSALVGVLLLVLTLLGLKLQQQISHLEERPALPAGASK